jgi:hypothetical protein
MELDQIDSFYAHAFEGTVNLPLGFVIGAFAGLRCQKESSGILSKPRRDSELSVPVAGGNIEVVDPVA